VPLQGTRQVHGFRGEVMGPLDAGAAGRRPETPS
jgi:urease beta subunit